MRYMPPPFAGTAYSVVAPILAARAVAPYLDTPPGPTFRLFPTASVSTMLTGAAVNAPLALPKLMVLPTASVMTALIGALVKDIVFSFYSPLCARSLAWYAATAAPLPRAAAILAKLPVVFDLPSALTAARPCGPFGACPLDTGCNLMPPERTFCAPAFMV